MMATTELTQLQAECAKAHTDYRAARVALATTINKTPDSEAVSEFVGSLEELGLHGTLHRLKTQDPAVKSAITAMMDASDLLSLAVGEREQFLLQQNPSHTRVYVHDGREFTLDMEKGIWTYLDDPNNPITVTLTKQDKLPYDLPGFEPPSQKPQQKKKRQPRM
jgi:hypothetical protein